MRKPKVGLFSQYYPIYRDGVFRHLSACADFDFSFFAGSPPWGSLINEIDKRDYEFHSIRVFNIPIHGTRNSISYRTGVISALLQGRFDALVISNDILGIDIWICVILSRLRRIPVVIWGQGMSRPPSLLRDTLRFLLTTLASAALYYTDGGKDYWVRRGIPREKLFVAYNALDTDKQIAKRKNLSQDDLDEFLRIQDLLGKFIVTFLGRLIPEKKTWVFLEAIQEALTIEPDIVGLVIGDGPERQPLEEQAEEMGISKSVRFVGACYDENALAKYLMSSIAVLIPAFAGLAIQHAAVYGAPLVLGDLPIGHMPEQEIVQHEKTGLWCPDEDVDAFASAIIRLRQDQHFRRMLSENLKRVIDEKYNVEQMAQGFFDALRYVTRT